MSAAETPAAVEALMPTIRAALLRAYEHGERDTLARLAVYVAAEKPEPQKRACALKGETQAGIIAALEGGAQTAQEVANRLGIATSNAQAQLSSMAKAGQVRRLARGVYAPAVQR